MRINSKVDAIISLLPDTSKRILNRFMTHSARNTLHKLIDWGVSHAKIYDNNTTSLMNDFVKKYNQITLEKAEQVYDTEYYVKVLDSVSDRKIKLLNQNCKEGLMSFMTANMLFDDTWASENNIKRRNHVGDIGSCSELYGYLVDNFLTSDFNISDLGRIVQMSRMCSMDTIKSEAEKIGDIDKRSVAYLYAVIRGTSSRDEYVKNKELEMVEASKDKLDSIRQLVVESANKIPLKSDDNSLEKWNIYRRFIDIIRNK